MRPVANYQPALATTSGYTAELIVQGILATPNAMNFLNEWREQGIYNFQQLQDAKLTCSSQDHSDIRLSQATHLSTETYAELGTTYPQYLRFCPQNYLPQGDTPTEPRVCDESSLPDQTAAIKAIHNRSCVRLQRHRESLDYHRDGIKFHHSYLKFHQEGVKMDSEGTDLEKSLLTELDAALDDAQAVRQHKSQGGNYNRKNNAHDNNSSGAGQGHQQRPDDAEVPNFMREYLSGQPEAKEPPADDESDVKRCSFGRPLVDKLQKGTVNYQIGRCDKHLRQSVFDDHMKMQIEGQKGCRLIGHAWKCSSQVTLRPRSPTPVERR